MLGVRVRGVGFRAQGLHFRMSCLVEGLALCVDVRIRGFVSRIGLLKVLTTSVPVAPFSSGKRRRPIT